MITIKRIISLFLCACFLIFFTSCAGNKNNFKETSDVLSDNADTEISLKEYADISNLILRPDTYTLNANELNLPTENIFIENERMTGFDYILLSGVFGTLTVYKNGGTVSSLLFSGTPFNDENKFSAALDEVNSDIADRCGMEIAEPVFTFKGEKTDEVKMIFDGTGVVSYKYDSEKLKINIRGCGVNGEAAIMVEASPIN